MTSASKFYSEVEAAIGSSLEPNGFARTAPGEYRREGAEGEDVVAVDPDLRRGRFSLALCFYPAWTAVIDMLSTPSAQRGFPCGPYLSPVGVGRREYFWPCKPGATLERSVASVKSALLQRGLPWLTDLRDPRNYAASVDPVAALYAAIAFEKAGDDSAARSFYQEVHRRMLGVLDRGGADEEFLRSAGRKYLFVARKLGIEDEVVRLCETLDSTRPQTPPT